jgi:hypothetical protein
LVILPKSKKKGGRKEVQKKEEKKEVKKVKEVKDERESIDEVEKANAAAEALNTYVKDAKAAGMTKEEIQSKLIGAGWPKDSVNDAIKTY